MDPNDGPFRTIPAHIAALDAAMSAVTKMKYELSMVCVRVKAPHNGCATFTNNGSLEVHYKYTRAMGIDMNFERLFAYLGSVDAHKALDVTFVVAARRCDVVGIEGMRSLVQRSGGGLWGSITLKASTKTKGGPQVVDNYKLLSSRAEDNKVIEDHLSYIIDAQMATHAPLHHHMVHLHMRASYPSFLEAYGVWSKNRNRTLSNNAATRATDFASFASRHWAGLNPGATPLVNPFDWTCMLLPYQTVCRNMFEDMTVKFLWSPSYGNAEEPREQQTQGSVEPYIEPYFESYCKKQHCESLLYMAKDFPKPQYRSTTDCIVQAMTQFCSDGFNPEPRFAKFRASYMVFTLLTNISNPDRYDTLHEFVRPLANDNYLSIFDRVVMTAQIVSNDGQKRPACGRFVAHSRRAPGQIVDSVQAIGGNIVTALRSMHSLSALHQPHVALEVSLEITMSHERFALAKREIDDCAAMVDF